MQPFIIPTSLSTGIRITITLSSKNCIRRKKWLCNMGMNLFSTNNLFREVNEDNVVFRNVLVEFEESFKYVSGQHYTFFVCFLLLTILYMPVNGLSWFCNPVFLVVQTMISLEAVLDWLMKFQISNLSNARTRIDQIGISCFWLLWLGDVRSP